MYIICLEDVAVSIIICNVNIFFSMNLMKYCVFKVTCSSTCIKALRIETYDTALCVQCCIPVYGLDSAYFVVKCFVIHLRSCLLIEISAKKK